jgi:biopolymer transport protein TolR
MRPTRQNRARLVHRSPPKLDQVRNEINVTPLVDVCLVLLIIFMVILPMLARGKDVPVPDTLNHSKEKDSHQPIVALSLQEDETVKIYVDKDPMADLDAMKARIQDDWKALQTQNQLVNADRSGEGRVLIKADERVKYKQVHEVIMALQDIQAVGIDMGTNEAKEAAPGGGK